MRYLLCVFYLLFVCLCAAQEKSSFFPNKKVISFSPLALADIDHAATFGAEYFLNKKTAIVLDAGYIFNSDYLNRGLKNSSGFTFRPAIRLYGKSGVGYWQNQILYKMVTYNMLDWLGKDCVNDVPAYEQLQNFKYRKQVFGLNTMLGRTFRLFSDRWYFDAYAGLGIRSKVHHVIKQPNSCYNLPLRGFININEDNIKPSIPLGFKIGFVL
jgi:hypothetical protein